MSKLLHWINGIKLRHKLSLFYICFCSLPVLVLFGFSFIQMRQIIEDKEKINLQSYLYQSVATMDSNIEVYNNLSDYIAFDQVLLDSFQREYESPFAQYEQISEVVDPMLQSLKYFHDEINRITIYTDNGMVKHDTTIAPVSEIAQKEWYQSVQLASGNRWFVDKEEKKVFLARLLPVESRTTRPDVMYIEIDFPRMFEPYERTMTSEYGVFITDKQGDVIYSCSRFSDENSQFALNYPQFVAEKGKGEDSRYAIISEDSVQTGWKVWLYQPGNITRNAMRPIAKMSILTLLLCISGAVLAYLVISAMVSKRIENLTARMVEVEKGDLEVEVSSEDADEIGLLYRGFGRMLKQIRMLIEEVYVSKITQKESEMKALQAQINPHFLYNTLSLINWKALAAGEEDISKMTLAMSTFYRTSLNKGKNMLRVEDELKNTRAYLEIQSMMHDHDFDYEILTEPEILSCESLNLILQPLVENAIMHGIEQKTTGRGRITIRGWMQDECIWFSVEDNGIGMDAETAQRILTIQSKGYGVRNVNERIGLMYGAEYGITVESTIGEGTRMMLHFPIVKKNDINLK